MTTTWFYYQFLPQRAFSMLHTACRTGSVSSLLVLLYSTRIHKPRDYLHSISSSTRSKHNELNFLTHVNLHHHLPRPRFLGIIISSFTRSKNKMAPRQAGLSLVVLKKMLGALLGVVGVIDHHCPPVTAIDPWRRVVKQATRYGTYDDDEPPGKRWWSWSRTKDTFLVGGWKF